MRVAISFDYDSPAGYRESFSQASLHSAADFEGTEALLKVLAEHQVKTTFAIVGNAALDGAVPEHCPDQVRAIRDAGHEIASHSMYHRYIPAMRRDELLKDLSASKQALEACTGLTVRGFVPPFNRPSHFPEKGSFSFSEMAGLHRRGRGRQSAGTLLEALGATGFSWCRVSFQSPAQTLRRMLGRENTSFPAQPFLFRGALAIPLHATGFGSGAVDLLRRYMDTDLLITLCGHPFQALDSNRVENNEHVDHLAALLDIFCKERISGKLKFCTMAEAETEFRASSAAALPALLEEMREGR
jgi:peptidoglycan/xylan/chitin deacetylase (PgdA/CDA1 family)